MKTPVLEISNRRQLEVHFPEAVGVVPPKSWQTRRRQRLFWFLAIESIVVLVMVLSILAGVSVRFASESLTPIFRVLPVAAAVVATIFPILVFGNKRSPR